MYLDAANRSIKEPIDYLIEAQKKSKKLCLALHLSGEAELLHEAELLNNRITAVLAAKPIEEWETAKHSGRRESTLAAAGESQ